MHHFFRVMSQLSLLIWILVTAIAAWSVVIIKQDADADPNADGLSTFIAQMVPVYAWTASLGILVGSALFHIAAEITLLRKATENSK